MDFRNEFEIEVKFLFNLYENLRFYGIIKETLNKFRDRSKTKCRFYSNHYYDTLDLKLYNNQISLRQTRDTNDMFITNTFKINVSDSIEYRREINDDTTLDVIKVFEKGIINIKDKNIKYINPKDLLEVMKVEVEKNTTLINIGDNDNPVIVKMEWGIIKFFTKLINEIDDYQYESRRVRGYVEYDKQLALEFELKNNSTENIEIFNKFIKNYCDEFKLETSSDSNYGYWARGQRSDI